VADKIQPRETGVVRWFSSSRGYGFIRRSGGQDVFLHRKGWWDEGLPAEGMRVSFVVIDDPKGPRAGWCCRIGYGFDIVVYGHGGSEWQLFVERYIRENRVEILDEEHGHSRSYPGGYVRYKLRLEPGTMERAWEEYRQAQPREVLRRRLRELEEQGLRLHAGDIADGIDGRNQDWCAATIKMIPEAIEDPRVIELAQALRGEFYFHEKGWSFSTFFGGEENEARAIELAEILGGHAFVYTGSEGYEIGISSDPGVLERYPALIAGQKSFRTLMEEAVAAKLAEVDSDEALTTTVAARDAVRAEFKAHLAAKPELPEPLEVEVDSTEGWFAGGRWCRRGDTPLGYAPGRRKVICRHPDPEVVGYGGELYELLWRREDEAKRMLEESRYYLETETSKAWLRRACELATAYQKAHEPIWEAAARLFRKGWPDELCRAHGIDLQHRGAVKRAVWAKICSWGNQGAVKAWSEGRKIWWPTGWFDNHSSWEWVGDQMEGYPTPQEIDVAVAEARRKRAAQEAEEAFWSDLIKGLQEVTDLGWDDYEWWTDSFEPTADEVPVRAAFVGGREVARTEVWYTRSGGFPYYRLWKDRIEVPESYLPGSLRWCVVDHAPASRP